MALRIAFMLASLFVCIAAPLFIALVRVVRRKGRWYMFVLGVVSFTASQLLLRIPILEELHNAAWFNLFIVTQPVQHILLLALSAGVFEEAGRYAAMRFLNRGLLTWDDAMLFGLGHGGVEAIWLVGLPLAGEMAEILSGKHIVEVLSTPAINFLIYGIERALAVTLHIGLTMLVFYSIRRKDLRFLLLAVLFHALVDIFAFLPYIWGIGDVWLVEGAVAVFAAAALVITIKMRTALGAATERDCI